MLFLNLCFFNSSLPMLCEVDDPSLRDALLSSDYDDLPPLRFVRFYYYFGLFLIINYRSGSLKSWSVTANSGVTLVQFSQWAVQCPDLDFEYVFSSMIFIVQSTSFYFLTLEMPATLFVLLNINTLLDRLGSLLWTSISITLPLTVNGQSFNVISRQPSALARFYLKNVSLSILQPQDYATSIYQVFFINWNGNILKPLPAWFSTKNRWLLKSTIMWCPLVPWDLQNVCLNLLILTFIHFTHAFFIFSWSWNTLLTF